jgi:hypothetical protein
MSTVIPATVVAAPEPVNHVPPVTIGEIHVHVAGPAETAADPLAMLAPYTGGLTARRAGVP